MPWTVPEFRTGFVVGVVAAALVLAASALLPRLLAKRMSPLAGVALAAGGLVAIDRTSSLPGRVVVATLAIGVIAFIAERLSWPALAPAVLVAPCAYILTHDHTPANASWFVPFLVVATAVGVTTTTRFEASFARDMLTPVLFAISAAGVFFAVPDTELPGALLGVALPIAFLAWPLRRATLGAAGGAMSIAVYVRAVEIGAIGRPASVVGAMACLALLVGEPLARALVPRRDRSWLEAAVPAALFVPAVAVVQGVLALFASRAAGTRRSVTVAATAAALAVIGAVVAGLLVTRGARRREGVRR